MKNLKIMLVSCMAFASLALFGQAENSLSIQENGTFEIPSTNLKEAYSLDISLLELNSIDEAVEYFSEKNTDLITFRPNADVTEAAVFLQLTKKSQWTVSDWNNAISSINFLDN